MKRGSSRRDFLKAGVLLGAGALVGRTGVLAKTSRLFVPVAPDVAIFRGDDYYANTIRAVEALGGMNRFVGNGSTVGLLVNSRYNKPGTFVKPEIVIAALDMCFAAGAKKIISLENVTSSYWRLSGFSKNHSEVVGGIENAGNGFRRVKIPDGISLREAEVRSDLLECDAYINIPIFKQHEGVKITGCLKNIMGLTSSGTNDFFHNGSDKGGGYADVPFLSQCIADANMIRKPDLCIGDATEFITSNGPFGPGDVRKEKKIIAGKDMVAVDAVGARILGYSPAEILTIIMAHKHGLGEMDLKKVNIGEL